MTTDTQTTSLTDYQTDTPHGQLQELPHPETSTSALVLDTDAFARIMAVAEVMAKGKATLPKHLQDNPADCMAIIMQAMQWKMNPFVVAQKTHLVNGTLGYEAQLVNAVVSTSGAITGRFHYDYIGDWEAYATTESKSKVGLGVRVGAVIKGDDEITWGSPLYFADITVLNSPLWKTNPRQQIAYLAVKNWTRLYVPDALLGVYSTDELDPTPISQTRQRPRSASEAAQAARPTAQRTEQHDNIVLDLEAIARDEGTPDERMEKLAQAWQGLTREDRLAIGQNELRRLQSIAGAEDVKEAAHG